MSATDLFGSDGVLYRLGLVAQPSGMCELRWLGDGEPVTLRKVVGALESYEPVRGMTRRALQDAADGVSTSGLRVQHARLLESQIVLNRQLREAVAASPMSSSEIARRCGRVKRDSRGNESGETSWLARRIGQLPEGGQEHPTPWVHSDVLALIAREGLGVAPRDVEVDVEEDVALEDRWCGCCGETVTTAPGGACPWCETDGELAPLLEAA